LGGIYALERIAKDSERDHWTIMEVLSAFVRENAPLKEDLKDKKAENEQEPQKLRTDIQAALTVIGRRDPEKDKGVLNLRSTDLRGANLSTAQLQGADFCEAKLQGAYLIKANLKEAQLVMANLEGAHIRHANLEKAKFWEANLRGAKLQEANLKEAGFYNANLELAVFEKANLEGAELSEAINLESWQIEKSFGDSKTLLPDNIKAPVHWT
jgi:uncharacterized protein YjbI with pentapeptide repeats